MPVLVLAYCRCFACSKRRRNRNGSTYAYNNICRPAVISALQQFVCTSYIAMATAGAAVLIDCGTALPTKYNSKEQSTVVRRTVRYYDRQYNTVWSPCNSIPHSRVCDRHHISPACETASRAIDRQASTMRPSTINATTNAQSTNQSSFIHHPTMNHKPSAINGQPLFILCVCFLYYTYQVCVRLMGLMVFIC